MKISNETQFVEMLIDEGVLPHRCNESVVDIDDHFAQCYWTDYVFFARFTPNVIERKERSAQIVQFSAVVDVPMMAFLSVLFSSP